MTDKLEIGECYNIDR